MRHTLLSMLTASTMLAAALVGTPTSARSQTIIIITGNGSAQPSYPQPYPYPQQQVVYDDPAYYPDYGYAASGYYQSYYNGYSRPYGYGYYRPHRYWGW